ncbi:MAG: GNAT family N-acetyltransferase [Nitrospirae bacterium]|nr:GNAT family N-acetyltransferase [Nitrospirota bacterium]
MKDPFLIGNKVYLRGIEESDLNNDRYFQWLNDHDNDLYTSHAMWPNTKEKMRVFYKRVSGHKNDVVFCIHEKSTDRHIGNIGLHEINWIHRRAELAILIGEKDAQLKGYGTEAINLLAAHAFNKLNLHRIGLGVNAHNEAAIRAYKKAGFVEEGIFRDHFLRNGLFTDVVRLAVIKKQK